MRVRPKEIDVSSPDVGADPIQRPHEVLDHPVCLGVVGVEPIQLAIHDQVDPGELLEVQYHSGGGFQHLLPRMRDQPRRDWIAADERRENAGRAHGSCTYWMSTPSARPGSTRPTTVPRE